MEFLVFVFVVAPLLWIALTIWCVVRQVTASKLRPRFFTAIICFQCVVLALPFGIYNWSVGAAGLSNFVGCPSGQEYCDEFYQLERLGDRMLFQLGVAFWAGIVIWGGALSASHRLRAGLTGT